MPTFVKVEAIERSNYLPGVPNIRTFKKLKSGIYYKP
jgi:hypothetical protein